MRNPAVRAGIHMARVLKAAGTLLLALLIVFEEWGWEPLARLMARIARLRILAAAEARIARLSPYAALAVMTLPFVLLVPLKIVAWWMIGSGQFFLGASLIAAAKVAGTAVVARMFALSKPALMQLGWFATGYGRWTTWKRELLERVRRSRVWQRGRDRVFDLRCTWNDWRTMWWA